MPSAQRLIEGGTFSKGEDGLWDTPEVAKDLLRSMVTNHKDQLAEISTSAGQTLLQVCSLAFLHWAFCVMGWLVLVFTATAVSLCCFWHIVMYILLSTTSLVVLLLLYPSSFVLSSGMLYQWDAQQHSRF